MSPILPKSNRVRVSDLIPIYIFDISFKNPSFLEEKFSVIRKKDGSDESDPYVPPHPRIKYGAGSNPLPPGERGKVITEEREGILK